jgi:PAS domain S-box-containing protein
MDYARAAALALGALLVQWAVRPYTQQSPFLLVTGAVLLAGWRGGWGPALVAIAIGAIGVDLLFLLPIGALSVTGRDFGTVALFVLVGLVITWLNVSRQRALRTANEQQLWLQTTLRSIADAVIATDRKGRIQFLNSVAETFTGWSAPEAMGRPLDEVFNVVNEKTGERVVNPVTRVIREGKAVGLSNHTALINRSGLKYIIEEAGAPIRGSKGELLGVVFVFHDATQKWRDQQRRQLLTEASSMTLASFLEADSMLKKLAALAVPRFADWCAVHLLENDGSIRLAAVAHADPDKVKLALELDRRFPQQADSPIGIASVIRSEKPEWNVQLPDEVLTLVAYNEEHLRLLRELRLRSYIIAQLRAHDRALGTITFVTAESGRRYEEADVHFANELAARAGIGLENARLYAEAQEAIRLRDEFLSVASHELKTPLTTLQLQLEGLNRAPPSTLLSENRLAKRLQTANRQTVRLTGLVENLLEVSRITTGRLSLQLEEVDLGELAADAAERFEAPARNAGCQLTIEAASTPVRGQWDRLKLDQVLANLLTNALKYGAGKPVRICVAESEGVARLSVIDAGIGIAAEDVSRIFGRFERAVSTRHYGGLGLGLFIVRQIVEAHGGEIQVRTKPNRGSEFTVLLPTTGSDAPKLSEQLPH